MAEPLVLGPPDSGVTYAAYRDERPVLSGGIAVTGWKPGANGVWEAAAPRDARGQVMGFNQLWVNAQRRTLARTPNYAPPGPETPLGSTEGYFTVVRKAPPLRDPATGQETDRARTALGYQPGSIKAWPNLDDVHVVLYHSWETSRHRIADVDETNQVVTFTGPACWPIFYFGRPQRYYVENAPDALDAPGEWYLDKQAGVVRCIPLPGEDLTKVEVIVPRLTRLLEMRGDANAGLWVENVTFRGLSFQYEDWVLEPQGHSDPQAVASAPAAIMANGIRNCAFEDCEIAHVGDHGIWLRTACKDNRLVKCRLHDLGIGGVRIGVPYGVSSDAETSSGNVVDNCHLYDGGHVYAGGVGLWVGQAFGNRLTHNEIHDFTYTGISIGWTWGDDETRCRDNVIEHNHVHHVMNRMLNDGGAIYTLGKSPGSIIRGNVFHDVWPWSAIGWGIYLDATTNRYLVEDNLVYHTLCGGWMGANGDHENVIQNNVFALFGQYALWPYWEKRPNTFRRNLVYLTQGELFWGPAERFLKERLAAGEPLGEWDYNLYWSPALAAVPKPDTPPYELLFFAQPFAEWQRNTGLDQHSVIADPRFVDVDKLDFRLQGDSPALKLGFQPFDCAEAGLYGDPRWVAEARAMEHPPTRVPPPPGPPEPTPVDDGFENSLVGTSPESAIVSGEEQGASIRVTDAQAAAGRHSLKVTDSPDVQPAWQPHFFYQPYFTRGQVRQSFDILLEQGALAYTEWRDTGTYPDIIGPSVTFDARAGAEGQVIVGGNTVMTVPLGQWVHVAIEAVVGKGAPGTWRLSVQAAGQEARVFTDLASTGRQFVELHWLGFVSTATTKAVFYLDNVKVQPGP
jgi:hypothetical protein